LTNLEWVTRSENCIHPWKNELFKTCKKVYEIEVESGKIIREYKSIKESAQILGISSMCPRIKNKVIKNGIMWSYENC
jgi:hypothetical protein